ncbi:UNVERIFIED_CONTAM: hypothetical protein NCL1_35939 [Trichonephila clavipes]
MRRTSKISKYKAIILKFRVKELKLYLDFINENSNGVKLILQKRIYDSLNKVLSDNEQLPPELEDKIKELHE